MISRFARTARSEDLQSVIRSARMRWRLRVVLHGVALVIAVALALLLLGAAGVEQLRYDPRAVIAARVLVVLAFLVAAAWLLARPLMRRLPDDQVALYLEEHEPSLEMALLSAVEHGAGNVDTAARASTLGAQLEKSALARARAVDDGRRVERVPIQRAIATLGVAVLIGAILLGAGPEWLRRGTVVLLTPWRSAEAATPFAISVEPGNSSIAKGGDQEIAAQLRGFATSDVTLAVRRGLEGEWERIAMDPGADSATFGVRLFDLTEPTTYYIEANGIRSGVFRIDVVALPYVDRIDLEYRFPSYTGRPPEQVEGGGDIAALRGTTVRLTATPTMPSAEGRIIIDGRDTVLIAPGDSAALQGDLVVKEPGTYRIELRAADARWVTASLDYTIDVLEDEAPTVRVTSPGRDEQVTSIEEVFIEAEANDDYVVRGMELVYTVNGGAEQVVPLVRGGRRASTTAGHTLFLEEMSLEAGDLIAYHVRATDGRPNRTEPARSDIYFLNVRPFGRDYRQAESGGGGGGGGGAESPQGMSRQQREIVAATFNVIRDRAQSDEAAFREAVTTVALGQGRLREQVETLVRRLGERGAMGMDSTFHQITIALAAAADEMKTAETQLGERKPNDALAPEQRALRHLQQAEAQYRDVQVAMGGQQSQGGGGGGGAAEDLADLFELETDKLRNQYETVQRGEQRQADEQVDEVAERLRRLAARQQQANERQQRSFGQQGGSGGDGSAQRALAEEAEEAARQLERLARERRTPELEDAARRLRESAAAMRRAAAGGQQSTAAEGAAALDRLRDARRRLEETRSSRLRRDLEGVRRNADRLANDEREIAREVGELDGTDGAGRQEQVRRLSERKDAQAQQVDELAADLDRLSREGRRDQPESARKLQEAAQGVRDDRLRDRIAYSKGLIRGNSPEYIRSFEEEIGASIERARERIAEAERAVGEPQGARESRALEQARGLVRSLEALGERLPGEAGEQRGQAQQGEGQEGQQGQGQGQQGQQGQGQQGQGQQGQQGQGQQGQGQGGQQGQQGPGGQQGQGGQQPSAGGMPGSAGQGAPGGGRMGGGRLSPDEQRQLEREYRARRLDAEALRRELRQSGADVESLQQWIARLQELERGRSFDDPEELARLHAAVVEGLKAYEFALRRTLESGDDRPLLDARGEVPPGFKALVEEYYKSLARPR